MAWSYKAYKQVEKDLTVCQYCNSPVKFQDVNNHISRAYWFCPNCLDARVGSHPDGTPLGIVAKLPLRRLRMDAHGIFDKMVAINIKLMGRHGQNATYRLLANEMKMPVKNCHFALFNEAECSKALSILRELIKDYDTD